MKSILSSLIKISKQENWMKGQERDKPGQQNHRALQQTRGLYLHELVNYCTNTGTHRGSEIKEAKTNGSCFDQTKQSINKSKSTKKESNSKALMVFKLEISSH